MYQDNINGNFLYGTPFVTPDSWVWFRGTDSTLWKVRTNGSGQQRFGNIKTLSTPVVTADGWVWWRGGNLGTAQAQLFKMRTDGSQQSQPGGNLTASAPAVTADGWVWFQGTNDVLYRMKADGSDQTAPGGNKTKDTPVITPDGWVWFRGTAIGTDKDALFRMKTDGTQKSRPGNNAAKSAPFVTADGWVWFQGTDDGLNVMRADGSQKSQPGGNQTKGTPFVTPEGWVYFRGTNDGLYRMFKDGSQRSVVDGNHTNSSLFVGPITTFSGSAGEWVYWQGTDNRLWRDMVPATAQETEVGIPAYYILTAAYAPPGFKGGGGSSAVVYSSGSATGTTTTTSSSFKAGTEVAAGGDDTPFGVSYAASVSTTDSESLSITKDKDYSFEMPGPGVDGIDHDYDLFLLLLNPVIIAQKFPQNVVLWSMGVGKDPERPFDTALVYGVYAGQLKGTMEMPDGLAVAFRRRGMTQADYDQILSTNPLSQGQEKIDPDRFVLTQQSFPYTPPPDPNTSPVKFTLTLTNSQTSSKTHETETEYTVGMKVGISFFKDETKLTWTSKNTLEQTSTTRQSASATVGGPAYGYQGPVSVLIYWDTLYRTFMFAFADKPASVTGTLRDDAGKPLPWEPVTLTAGDSVYSTFTDWDGEYRFHDIPRGEGTVAYYDGHHRHVDMGGAAPGA